MFPVTFAFDVVNNHAPANGRVLDPFAGRGSSVYAAAATGREALGIEINSVGWVYGHAKLARVPQETVLERLRMVELKTRQITSAMMDDLPQFFRACYSDDVLRFLLTARRQLRWRRNPADTVLMSHLLIYLHGKLPSCLSNQMPQGKALAPEYALRWWAEHGTRAPALDPVAFLKQRLAWRYKKGLPDLASARVLLGDSTRLMRVVAAATRREGRLFDLLFTSPPYYGVVTYHADQWLRGWLLGGEPRPIRNGGRWQSRFDNQEAYRHLLTSTWRWAARVLSPQAEVYIRTDARPFTLNTTVLTLRQAFPHKRMTLLYQPVLHQTQTYVLGDRSLKPGEVDILLSP